MKNGKKYALLALLLPGILLLGACGRTEPAPRESAAEPALENAGPDAARPVDASEDLKWWQKTIAYEIYVKSFKDSDGDGIGDLKGVTSELDHLKALGVGAIWLTPCYVSPQADNGYDIADYYNIDPAYGTMADMDELIAEAGKRGIRIVMDLVFNHTSNENRWFRESRSGAENDKSDWYIWADPRADGSAPTNWRSIFGGSAWTYDETRGQYYLHTFLPEQPDLNWANPAVRRALGDVANFWVDKGVGGFRMDAITYIKKPAFEDGTPDAGDGTVSVHAMTANTEGILDYLHEFKAAVREDADIFTVGEANGVSAEDLPDWVGPDGVFDMVFEFGHVNIDLPDEMNWCETRAWTLPELKSLFAASQKTTARTNGWYPMFLENHDQPRSINRYLPAGADRNAGAKALATLVLTMRGTPFLMQGEELGFVNVSWPSIEDYNDISTKNHYQFAIDEGYSEAEALAGVHRFARDSARTPMQWDGTRQAGFTTGEPWLPVYDDYADYNAAAERQDPDSVLNWYIALAALRGEHAELVEGSYEELFHEDERIVAFVRESGAGRAVVLINLSTEPARYDPSCVENAVQLLGTHGESEKGVLAPLEAVIFET
jgi:alpha-glucosidase